MKIKKSITPTKAGFYFVKLKSSPTWQLFVEIVGIKPFMGVNDDIHVISGSDSILHNLVELDWSLPIDLNVTEATKGDEYCGFTIVPKVKEQIISYLRQGSKLAAVKYLKEESKDENNWSLGLKEAKDYCDQLQKDLNL